MHIEVLRYQNQLDDLFKLTNEIGFNPRLHGEYAKYLCVRVSGYMESSIRHILRKYCTQRSSTNIQRRMDMMIGRITNCTQEKILSILNGFDPKWESEYLIRVAAKESTEDIVKDSINSIIDRRHSIAHGGAGGIGIDTVDKYYSQCKIAISIIHDIVLGEN